MTMRPVASVIAMLQARPLSTDPLEKLLAHVARRIADHRAQCLTIRARPANGPVRQANTEERRNIQRRCVAFGTRSPGLTDFCFDHRANQGVGAIDALGEGRVLDEGQPQSQYSDCRSSHTA